MWPMKHVSCTATLAFLSILLTSSLIYGDKKQSAFASGWEVGQLAYYVGGQWIQNDEEAYDRDIEIRTGDKLGKRKKVDGVTDPKWSADGHKIAFLGPCDYGCGGQIIVMDADGSNRRMITGLAFGKTSQRDHPSVSNFSWSPVEDKIAYVEQKKDNSAKVIIINADGSGRKEVAQVEDSACYFNTESGGGGLPAWSPNGLALAFTACVGRIPVIMLTSPDGTGVRPLVKEGRNGVWAPDNKHLLFLHGPTTNDPMIHFCIIGVDGKDQKTIFKDKVEPSDLTWLPNGKSIAFTSMRDNKSNAEVFQINIDGTGLKKLVPAGKNRFSFSSLAFSPDGNRLVVGGYRCCPDVQDTHWQSDATRSAVILIDLESNQQRILANGLDPSVVWVH